MMSIKKPAIFVGAGAEGPGQFDLPIGADFTCKTCYTKNIELYNALRSFYKDRLSSERLPDRYEARFLYRSTSPQFKQLIANSLPDSFAADCDEVIALDELIRPKGKLDRQTYDKIKSQTLDKITYDLLFEQLVTSSEDSDSIANLKRIAIGKIRPDAYYGTIESYFSSLLEPSVRSTSFWKLINYYWTAFFVIAEPIIRRSFENDTRLRETGVYSFTLSNLGEVVSKLSSSKVLGEPRDSYYCSLSDKFDAVITTNYTPFTSLLKTAQPPIYLSGALWKFENPETLVVRDIRDKPISSDEFVFPYLMTQAPIKPAICWEQLNDYRKTLNTLEDTDDLFMLGYSLCQNDAHIASLIGSWLTGSSSHHLHFFFHRERVSETEICKRLRIEAVFKDRITTHPNSEIKSVVESL